MELVADGTAGVTEEIERVLAALELREGELAEAMLGAILGPAGRRCWPTSASTAGFTSTF